KLIYIIEKNIQIKFEGFYNFKKNGQRGYGTVIFDLRNEAFTHFRIVGQFLYSNSLAFALFSDFLANLKENMIFHLLILMMFIFYLGNAFFQYIQYLIHLGFCQS